MLDMACRHPHPHPHSASQGPLPPTIDYRLRLTLSSPRQGRQVGQRGAARPQGRGGSRLRASGEGGEAAAESAGSPYDLFR